jgi:dTDP-4-dehydrorhamnose reductase
MRLVVLVTGASGQLGQALHHIGAMLKSILFFCNSKTLDVTDKAAIKVSLKNISPILYQCMHILRLIKQSKNPKSIAITPPLHNI